MRIRHRIGTRERSIEGEAKLFLTNKKGNYLALGPPASDFDGLFTYDSTAEKLFKVLHDIRLEGQPDTVTNCLTWAERASGHAQERFFLTSNACIYEVDQYRGEVTITADCKQLYDDSAEKRIYASSLETIDDAPSFHLHYTKYMDLTPRYTRHVLITAVALEEAQPSIQPQGFWREVHVPYDERRRMSARRWVYDACTIRVGGPTRIFITSSSTYEKALEKMQYVLDNQDSVISANMKYPEQRYGQEDLIRALTMHAVDALVTKRKHKTARGVFAGLPWFFQFWMRDEGVVLKALLLQKQYALVKEIIMRWMESINSRDTKALSGSTIDTADGPGIIAQRTWQLLRQLKRERQLDHFFSTEELQDIADTFKHYISTLTYQHGLVKNGTNETWMDTNPHGDGREGTRVEIQTLTLCIYDLLSLIAELTGTKNALLEDRKKLLDATREWFFDSRGWLVDGFFPDGTTDIRTRPNVFLAWYFQPGLLSPGEWKQVFDHALEKLWLPWGGLSSIGHDDPQYRSRHTGVTNESYHLGDSWYWINNIAAMALFTVDAHGYDHHIEKLVAASTRDLLGQGYAGHASEISDAESQQPAGCFAQAWSAATFLELLTLMRPHNSS